MPQLIVLAVGGDTLSQAASAGQPNSPQHGEVCVGLADYACRINAKYSLPFSQILVHGSPVSTEQQTRTRPVAVVCGDCLRPTYRELLSRLPSATAWPGGIGVPTSSGGTLLFGMI